MLEITLNSNPVTSNWTVYQPLIVSFIAVFLGLFANTRLEWSKRKMDRELEAKGLRAALLSEIKANRQAIDGRMESGNDIRVDSSGIIKIPLNYNDNIDKEL
jgi:hypothetical protein